MRKSSSSILGIGSKSLEFRVKFYALFLRAESLQRNISNFTIINTFEIFNISSVRMLSFSF